jgi:hypothetical protein
MSRAWRAYREVFVRFGRDGAQRRNVRVIKIEGVRSSARCTGGDAAARRPNHEDAGASKGGVGIPAGFLF